MATNLKNTNRLVNRLEISLELLNQFIVFFALFLGGIIGIAKRPNSDFYLCLLVIFPVLILYFVRRKVKNFTLFMALNLAFPIASLFLAKNDIELVVFFLVNLIVVIRSIRIKTAMNKITEAASNAPVSKDFAMSNIEAKDFESITAYEVKERMHIVWALVMIIAYSLGVSNSNGFLIKMELVLFVAFVVLSLVSNQLRELNKVFSVNIGKSEFPVNRIISINTMLTLVIALLMGLFMFLFYYGPYGNIFTILGGFFIVIIREIMKFILMIWGSSKDEGVQPNSNTSLASDDLITFATNENSGNSALLNAAFEVIAMAIIIAVIFFLIYMILKYAKGFRKGKLDEMDEVEFLDESSLLKVKPVKKEKEKHSFFNLSNNQAYRKLYKKYAKSKKRMTSFKKSGLMADYLYPSEISEKLIVEDEIKAREITKSYEKARYSEEEVTKEELDYLKKV